MNDTIYTIEEIISTVEKQERLQTFIYCLYTGTDYKLSKLKSLDYDNFNIAMYVLKNVYPENIFGDINRFK